MIGHSGKATSDISPDSYVQVDGEVELTQKTPFWDQLEDGYNPSKEFIREQSYAKDLRLLKLKQSL